MRDPQEYTGNEIAIVGMSGRFPGARTPEEFWQNVVSGVESIRVLAEEELREAGATEAELADPRYVRAAAVLDDVEWWDAGFWGMTPLDASVMDPQHRLFLEVAWEALEDAGHAPEQFPGAIGVYAGCGMQAYFARHLLPNRRLMEGTGLFLVRHTGNDKDFLSTRVSFQLNLRGPSVNVQTACSTSLVAVHMAAQSLLSGECDMALAGGVTIEIPHRQGYTYKENEILSPDGHCRAFEARSAGTVFGSGAGVVVLRRLADALRDGDRVHAVILGSAINNDGSQKAGYLAPSVDGQSASIVEALAVAGADPDSIQYIETHGTGTPVGDPIEVAALTQAFRTGSSRNGFCAIGSVKPNIGHLDTAAGIAGMIKAVMGLKHGTIPPMLHFEAPNPAIDFPRTPFFVPPSPLPWKADGPRRAGVSSLGVGGTNAHIVLEEGGTATSAPSARAQQLLVLSAKSRTALDAMSANLADRLAADPSLPLADVAFTLSRGRQALKERRVVVAATASEAIERLAAGGAEASSTDVASERNRATFLFAGGGAQFPGMGAGIARSERVYRDAIEAALAALPAAQASQVRAFLADDAAGFAAADAERPTLALPALFATQYATAQLLSSWDIEPDAMIGHSLGEYAAAQLAGVFSLPDAMRLVAKRAELFERLEPGAMLSVPLSEAELLPLLGSALSVAAVNAPSLCVAAGPVAAIDALEATLRARGIDGKRLHIAVAAHSAMLEPILDDFRAFVRSIRLSAPTKTVISNETGLALTAAQATDPEYWVRHLRHTVRFADGIGGLLGDGTRTLIEVGPGRTLVSLARQHPLFEARHATVTTFRAPQDSGDDAATLAFALGRIWTRGHRVDWDAYWRDERRQRVGLPTYPWERQRHWIDAPQPDASAEPSAQRRNRVEEWSTQLTWQECGPADLKELTGPVLVYADAHGVGDALAELLRAEGQDVIVAAPDSRTATAADAERIAAGSREAHRALFASLAAESRFPKHVVFAWSLLDEGEADLATTRALGLDALMALAQGLGDHDPEAALRVTVVTNGVHRIGGDEPLLPANALVLGPARVLPRELTAVEARSVDVLVPRSTAVRRRLADALRRELATADAPEHLALRGALRFMQALTPREWSATGPALREGGTYLITGGLGGIASELAAHLASVHRARLILVVRSAPDARSEALRRRLETLGATVTFAHADLADAPALATAIAAARAATGPIHGVFHAAGVLDDGLMATKTPASVARVLRPKVEGTVALDAAVADDPLEFFLCFSSISAIAGLPGQADYAAANAFLDAFVQEREARTGQRGIAVGWSAWSEVGMAAALAQPSRQALHPALGARLWSGDDGALFGGDIALDTHWLVADHRVRDGHALMPGTGFVELVRAAAQSQLQTPAVELTDLAFLAPFIVPESGSREIRCRVRSSDGLIVIGSHGSDGQWIGHLTGRVRRLAESPSTPLDVAAIDARCTRRRERVDATRDPYMAFGPRWHIERDVAYGDGEAVMRLALPAAFQGDLADYPLHPALLDFATAGAQAVAPGVDPARDFFVPLAYGRLRYFAPLQPRVVAHVRAAASDLASADTAVFDVTIADEHGTVLVEIDGFVMRRIADRLQLTADDPAPARALPLDLEPPATAHRPMADVEGGIRPAEGMRAIEHVLASPPLAHVLVSPQDPRSLIPALRGTASGSITAASPDPDPQLRAAEPTFTDLADVRAVALRAFAAGPGRWKVIAFVESALPAASLARTLRERARRHLPASLLPTQFVDIASMPRAADGSIDRSALVDPTADTCARIGPRTNAERVVADLWRELIGLSQPAVTDNFFEVGGHSLLAIRLLARMRRLTGLELPLSALFRHPTLEAFSALYASALPESSEGTSAARVVTAEPETPLPETMPPAHLQAGIWAGEQARPGTTTNHVSGIRLVRGPLDRARLQAAAAALVARHDALRLRLRLQVHTGEPLLVHDAATAIELRWLDLTGVDVATRDATLQADLARPFDLAVHAPLRLTVAHCGPAEHLLQVTAHHMFIDGGSLGVIWRDLLALYADPQAALPSAPSFRRWALAQRAAVDAGRYEAQRAVWQETFATLPPPLDLAVGDTDADAAYEGGTVVVPIPDSLVSRVDRGTLPGGTPFLVALAALQSVLTRYTGQSDIAIAVPALLNADDDHAADAVGLYINTLIVRDTVDASQGFAARVAATKAAFLRAWDGKDLPFTLAVEALPHRRSTTRNPYFQVMLSFEQSDLGAVGRYGDLHFDRYVLPRTGTQAELVCYVRWATDGGALVLDYDASLLGGEQVAQLGRHMLRVMELGLDETARPLAQLPLLTDAERAELDARQGTSVTWPHRDTVAAIAATVARAGSRVAVAQGSEALSYAELWAQSGRVAAALAAAGIGHEDIVGVALPRTPALLAALLGIWRSGAAYLPLDPSFPADRLAYMRADAGCRLVIGDGPDEQPLERLLATGDGPVPDVALQPEQLAYVLYTSGSTGRPKGVEVPHGALVNFLATMADTPGLVADDVLLAVTTLSFDIAGLELWLPLTVGARVELASSEDAHDADALMRRMTDAGVTVLQATPATWRMLLQAGWDQRLRLALCGGEAFPRELVAPLVARADAVWNMYGPTETTIWSTVAAVHDGGSGPVPIGVPIANTRVYVVDAAGELLPAGVPGELWIGGHGVARGYRGRPDLTAERFVPEPGRPTERAYRTGDLVRWHRDGMLEHLGRLDAQVKVNGYRIELGEIEAVLAAIPDVRQAAVAVRGGADDPRLVAFVAYDPHAFSPPSSTEIRRELRAQLPDYMIPAMVVELDAMPLTPNGKVDRKALPDPFADAAASRAAYEPPLEGRESSIAAVWTELLGTDRIGRHDNFFELGGHSLLALRAVWAIRERAGVSLDPRSFFFSTLAQLAESAS